VGDIAQRGQPKQADRAGGWRRVVPGRTAHVAC
jgi:hypothetical protein